MEPNYRRCLSCRRAAPKQEFWRVIRSHPSNTIALDQGMGRSAYLCPRSECLKAAQKKDRLSRVLKAPVANQVYETLWQRLLAETRNLSKAQIQSVDTPHEPPTV